AAAMRLVQDAAGRGILRPRQAGTTRTSTLASRIRILALGTAERPLHRHERAAVHLVGAALQPAGECARAGGEGPEEEEADGVARAALEFQPPAEAHVHRVEQGEEEDRAEPGDDERRPEDPDRFLHELSF